MSRPLRIEFPGAWYHVMNRGRRKERIFWNAPDYQVFLKVVRETIELFNLRVACFCLMPNHYHLLVQTPDGNISRCMRHIDGVYTQRFNRAYKIDGALFRGRYKSIVVEEDAHLFEVMRYIHRNPLEAKLVKHLEEYPWNSHHDYLHKAQRWEWLERGLILNMIASGSWEEKSRIYREFVNGEIPDSVEKFYSKRKISPFFGGDTFKKELLKRLEGGDTGRDVVGSGALLPLPSDVLKIVSAHFGISKEDLFKIRRGEENFSRDLSMYLVRKFCRCTLKEVGEFFGIGHYSTVSNAMRRVAARKERDESVKKLVLEIEEKIWSQIKT